MSPATPSTPGRRARFLLIPLWLALASSAFGAVYKWTDEEGVTHFSDLPPHQGAQRITVKPASLPPPGKAAAQETKPAGESDSAERTADGDQANPERAEYCRRARDDLKRYQAAERLVRENEQGKTVVISNEEREKLLEGVRKDIEKWCK